MSIDSDKIETAYEEGSQSAWRSMLLTVLRHLGEEDRTAEAWRAERAMAVAQLRLVCRDFGDNDWDPDLHLADVIEKHLARHLWQTLDEEKP